MARNDAIVMTWTSLCATCDISCAMTPSSSSGVSLFIRPVVTQSTDLSALRPVAKAFGKRVVGDGHPRLGHVGQRAHPVHDAVQLRRLASG